MCVCILLHSPLHGDIGNHQWREPKQDLSACPPSCVEDGCVEGAGKGFLPVGRKAVGGYSFLGTGAWRWMRLVNECSLWVELGRMGRVVKRAAR
jgi:hypothetical protein